jgi:hypothetical protein
MYGNPEKKEAPAPEPASPEASAPEAKPEEQPKEPADPVKPLKAKTPEQEDDPKYWRHRAELMAGKYEAELPRYAEENRQLKARLAELELAPQPQAPVAEAKPFAPPQEVIDKYGEDFVADMVKLMPSAQMPQSNAELDSLKAEIARLKAAEAESSFSKFKAELATAAPQWEALNEDKEFNIWLDGIDMASGAPRRELFNNAVAQGDLQRTAYFFNSFGGQNQSWAESQKQPEPQVPPAEHYMSPQHSKAQSAPQGKKVWTSAEVAAFYDDVRKGRVAEDVATRIEQDIFSAQREGRFK